MDLTFILIEVAKVFFLKLQKRAYNATVFACLFMHQLHTPELFVPTSQNISACAVATLFLKINITPRY